MMEALKEWLIPYIISNIVFGISIYSAFKKTMIARIFLAGFFMWASYFNMGSAINQPELYLNYAWLDALPLYSRFINGFLMQHITAIVTAIAVGQFCICFGLILNKDWTKLSCAGGIIFGLAIAFYILTTKYKHDFIWKWHQYRSAQCSNFMAE